VAALCQVWHALAAEDVCTWAQYRLPDATTPTGYTLDITVDLADPFMVNGVVSIEAQQLQASKCIVMHADAGMDLSAIEVTAAGSTQTGAHALKSQWLPVLNA
jgi:hypothetical protein